MDKEKVINQWNEISDSDWYKNNRKDAVINKIIESPKSAFHHTIWDMLNHSIPDFTDKKICVPSSGDNHAVFAFALLGANVTSCDISKRQIENAAITARKYNLNIDFVCDDTMGLSQIADNAYDLVYTSNGVHVWIDDLTAMYKNMNRILKKDGLYIMFEIHPFSRPFSYEDLSGEKNIIIKKPYDDIGPFDIKYHWRLQDIINAIIYSGLNIKAIEEMFAEYGTYWFESWGGRAHLSEKELNDLYDWRTNPLAALPQWLGIKAQK